MVNRVRALGGVAKRPVVVVMMQKEKLELGFRKQDWREVGRDERDS